MAFWFLNCSEVWHNLLRLHNNLTQKKDSRADDFTDQTHHTHNGMHLRQITAGGIQLLPDVWNCINTDNIDSLICQEKEVIHHLVKYPRVLVIQIPLVWIEGRHNIMADFRKPGKIAWRCGWKYLRYGFLIKRRNVRIVEKEVSAHVLPVTLAGFFCPFMVLGSMVHDKVHAHADSLLMAGSSQLLQVIHGAKIFLHLAEISYCIAAIGSSFRCLQKWHKVNIVHIIFFQIIQLAFHAFHISGKIVNIKHHTQHVIFLVPFRVCLSLLIKCFQRILTLLVEGLHLVT